jgi:hypothetical protein
LNRSELGVEKTREFSVEQLESVLLRESCLQGERIFRIIATPHEASLFPRQRIAIDIERMEREFNVIRVLPAERDWDKLPERIIFFVSTDRPFEKAAEIAARSLNGAVDIMEISSEDWKKEVERVKNDRSRSRFNRADRSHQDMISLILSYKVLQFDLRRILSLVSSKPESEQGHSSAEDFEKRLLRFQNTNISFLSFSFQSNEYLVPSFMVEGFAWKTEQGRETEPEGIESSLPASASAPTGQSDTAARFNIILQGKAENLPEPSHLLAADRLVNYEDYYLKDISVESRVAPDCFDLKTPNGNKYLFLPKYFR